ALFDADTRWGRHPLWSRPLLRTRKNLLAGRLATIAVTVFGGLLLWSAARRFGEGAGLVTHALWCLSPTVLAQGALATLDAWVAALVCLVAYTVFRLVEAPTLLRAGWVGTAL